MRGKPLSKRIDGAEIRNIPAYAGKTIISVCAGLTGAEHPRVCGENPSVEETSRSSTGTSPRMRGKLEAARANQDAKRNIPAYAGKTSSVGLYLQPDAEHPRVCGENVALKDMFESYSGTSPRMRGKLRAQPGSPSPTRNIPAYAGKTWHAP